MNFALLNTTLLSDPPKNKFLENTPCCIMIMLDPVESQGGKIYYLPSKNIPSI